MASPGAHEGRGSHPALLPNTSLSQNKPRLISKRLQEGRRARPRCWPCSGGAAQAERGTGTRPGINQRSTRLLVSGE